MPQQQLLLCPLQVPGPLLFPTSSSVAGAATTSIISMPSYVAERQRHVDLWRRWAAEGETRTLPTTTKDDHPLHPPSLSLSLSRSLSLSVCLPGVCLPSLSPSKIEMLVVLGLLGLLLFYYQHKTHCSCYYCFNSFFCCCCCYYF